MTAGQAQVDPPDPHLIYADHLEHRVRRLMPLLRPAIHPSGPLHHLAQCSDGSLDFALTAVRPVPGDGAPAPDLATPEPDVAASAPGDGASVPGVATPEPVPVRSPADLVVVDQELSITAAYLDQRLAPLRSGHLIRLVAQAASGAFLCDLVLQGRHLVAAVLTDERELGNVDNPDSPDPFDIRPEQIQPDFADVDRADRELARLADSVRGQLNQPTLNAGAYRDDSNDSGPRLSSTPYRVGDSGHPLLPTHAQMLTLDGLHYLARYEQGALSFSVDILADPGLDDYAELNHPSARRRYYQELGTEFEPLAAELSRVLLPVIPDRLVRIVLDVELGAIYCFRLGPDAYLMGVTLKQRRVEAADRAMRQLASGLVTGTPG